MATLNLSDLEFIQQQILIAEAHAAGADLLSLVPDVFAPVGLRTVDGSNNSLVDPLLGASDQPFPTLVPPDPPGAYGAGGWVYDAQPRIISNLVADMTSDNPAAVQAFVDGGLGSIRESDGALLDAEGTVIPAGTLLTIPNVAPDAGLSAPFNSWFTFFGQFFDHGLDLVNKSSTEVIVMPLQPDDPLYVEGSPSNFMVVARVTKDADGNPTNATTPFVDQNQTYTSHPSHQVFLREYVLDADGLPEATGRLLDGVNGGLPTWADVKAQAHDILHIDLDDLDVLNLPLVLTDPYGNFVPGPDGFPQIVTGGGHPPPTLSGSEGTFVDASLALRAGHAFLNDIAHSAAPINDRGQVLTADADDQINDGPPDAGKYDDELLDRHFITGDGRGNENIALTSVHHVFHAEHNRQIDAIKETLLASGDPAVIAAWQLPDGSWNGERLFQAARFATEMQYQHLVFEEFARKMDPNIDEFLAPEGYDVTINPAIVGEFAHAVFRVGHTMLTSSVDRFDAQFNDESLSLLDAFLNPVAFDNDGALTADQAAGAVVRGMTRQVGNEIDEFVTDAVRNTLLGLPLDLAAINIARGRDTGVPSLNEARREMYNQALENAATGVAASELKPYTSWLDLALNLKHEASVVNFIAAYGLHGSILAATTVADKRAAAAALVFGGADSPADRLDFLNGTGDYANEADGRTVTGVDDIDLWIGGLAEKQMPFGGMLGSTFNFIFENQLESLQNGDRFYYLSRTAGLHFGTELENNSFANLVMLNTDATHLPGDVFATPGLTLEVDPTKQFTGLGEDGRADPEGGTELQPLVIRDGPVASDRGMHYLRYTGPDHVVLGGTGEDDTLISSEGDDTLYGDEGNDRIEGGYGNDILRGGAGDDIITDAGGDDVIHGDEGNDVIHGGPGGLLAPQNLFGGDGSDFIITGEDISTTFGGTGNDFILGSKLNLPTLGNEGDDWIEIGTQDGAGGDNFDPKGMGTIRGNDVFITGEGFDEGEGEGGDDIMVMSDGQENWTGGGQFDWASYANDPFGVTGDLFINARAELPPTPSNQGIMDRFAEVEGLSGSHNSDYLRGDSDLLAHVVVGIPALDQTLENVGLYDGLQELLGDGATFFNSGNIILGGDGSDLLEGRGDNDIIDGDRWLNVRISVRENSDGTGAEIRSEDSMIPLVPDMLAGRYNPGQLQIVREILPGNGEFNYDTAMFSGNLDEYDITPLADGGFLVDHARPLRPNFSDGIDTVRNVERLQFNDQAMVLAAGNEGPTGLLSLNDGTPQVNQVLTVSSAGIEDADNGGSIAGSRIAYFWQVESVPGSGVFDDIVTAVLGNRESATGPTFTVTAAQDGLALRVRAVYLDGHGVLENVYSAPTDPVTGAVAPPPPPGVLPAESDVATPGVHLIRSDLQFILDQILIGEANSNAYGHDPVALRDLIPNTRLPWGLRTVDGSYNNLLDGQEFFGASDQDFPMLIDQIFRDDGDGDNFFGITNTNYATSGPGANVVDNDPRIISNLVVDQTETNPAAVGANDGATPVVSPGLDGLFGTEDDREVFFIPNVAPDAGLSSPFNAWFTFFGQFFDHGLDLVDKGNNGVIFVPLEADDPLVAGADGEFGTSDDLPVQQRFMLLTRADNTAVQAGDDGIFGTSDDKHFHNNETTPFVDQNQTYTSHASHQVFLREYTTNAAGHTVATGRLLDGANGGIGNWAEVKAQAAQYLGLLLNDADVLDVPLIATDLYGKFIPGPHGFAQLVTNNGLVEGVAGGLDIHNLPDIDGHPTTAGRTGHAFLNDIAHNAAPVFDASGHLAPDGDHVAGNVIIPGPGGQNPVYDDELLDKHFLTGDGRGNENIGLTTVHFIFHAEHNRLVDYIKDLVVASNDPDFVAQWKLDVGTPDESWNGERLFQAARFVTEMQYQHLVFEEFARRVQPNIDPFLPEGQNYESDINPAIVAEFAHVVYRFGHSMLTETVDRFDADFNMVHGDKQLGLIAAFLNPLEFTASGGGGADNDTEAASTIIRGLTRQVGNEIDEFVTEALRNNLLGLPLDLPAINMVRGRDAGVPTLNQSRAEFYAMTGDANLKPYTSWADLAGHLKHEASLVNFIASYGRHAELAAADVDTLADRRAVAVALVLGGSAVINAGTDQERIFVADEADRFAFLNSTGAYANLASGATTTGVDDIDLWIGGLAEKQTPFGGLLGSTFNFVFETQLENLQNADRFYYLERTASLNFNSELEGNSFARLIMANTDVTHLSGLVFSTPAFTLEVDPLKQYTGLDGGRGDPEGDVIRGDGFLQYTGVEHVVLGGSSGNDTLIGSEGDDTLWGDEGNDRLDGGTGNDQIRGGAGDDIITNLFGDDNLQGGDGNDAIHGGSGIELVIGGHGNDFIVGGNDATEIIPGPGNDFILAGKGNEFTFGNEGDDWIQEGNADGAAGDNFDVLSRDLIPGNDVFMGGGVADRMDGEGGDDIMIGMGGQVDRYAGFSGFDWASFAHPTQGAYADMNLRISNTANILPGSLAQTQTRFSLTEGMSGSAFSDVLIGDEAGADALAAAGANGSVLRNFDLIEGLHEFVGLDKTFFDGGNIILGGGGSDILQGNGGDDLIDGDMALDVYISVRANRDGTGPEVGMAHDMRELIDDVFSGAIAPGQLQIARHLVQQAPAYDTVVFRGNIEEYTIDTDPLTGAVIVSHSVDGGPVGIDGVDRLTNIERLQFANMAVMLDWDEMPMGLLEISNTRPRQGELITVSAAGVTDGDNPTGAITSPISYFWQVETVPGSGIFDDISVTTPAGDLLATGTKFRPGVAEAGLLLRVKAIYQDANGTLETVFSEPTAAVDNAVPTGSLTISDTSPTEGLALTATNLVTDPDGTTTSVFSFQWQEGALGGGGPFTDIVGATTETFTPTQDQVNRQLQVVVSFVDDAGQPETFTSAATIVTGDFIGPDDASQTLTGTEGQDIIFGGGGADSLIGLGGSDLLDGGVGSDTIVAGNGNDTISYVIGDGADAIDGGNGADTLNILGTAGSDLLSVLTSGGVLAGVAGGTVTGVETVTANLLGAADTLSYEGNAEGVTVNLGAGTASGFTTIAGVERVVGGSGNDTLAGGVDGDALDGGQGNDALSGGDSADRLTGAAGDDALTGDAGDDTLTGDAGGDAIDGGAGNDALTGGAGADQIRGGAGDDTIEYTLGDGADDVDGGADTDRLNIRGTALSDTLSVVLAAGLITQFDGSRVANVESVVADLLGDSDTLSYAGTTEAITVDLAGTASGFTSITGIENAAGGSGNDTLAGAAGVNTLTGRDGSDIYVVDNADVVVELAGGGAADEVRTASGSYTLSDNVENLTYTGTADFAGTGNAENNVITGGTAANVLSGLGGNDTLLGRGGTDALFGGAGNDTLHGNGGNDNLDGGSDADSLAGGIGNDTLEGGDGNDVINGGDGADIINHQVGHGSDVVTGGLDSDRLNVRGTGADETLAVILTASVLTGVDGGSVIDVESVVADLQGGTDTLDYAGNTQAVVVNLAGTATGFTSIAGIENAVGGSGNDTLTGAAGINTLTGGTGNDIYGVQDQLDVVVERAGEGTDEVRSTANIYVLSENVENLVFTGAGNFVGTGNALANVLTALGGADTLLGQGGNDTINGGAGNDALSGGAGNDAMNGGNDNDTLDGGDDNDALDGGSGDDRLLGGAGNDALDGGAAVDSLDGGAGTDSLTGGAGNDVMEGGAGNDAMDGGAGDDVFVFRSGFGVDRITGFDANPNGGQDLLDLRPLGITAANFATNVTITVLNIDNTGQLDTLIRFAGSADAIEVLAVAGNGQNVITAQDFMLG
ncbi:peroxidase family protein [Ramlibacter sp. PS3R-8]|uniref:peroxidase family protein n=1 Tax=Ramlibacter sp. PS3R-8 TaxID=3133437 RepID=UPI0030AE70FA